MDALPQPHWLDLVVILTLLAGLLMGAAAGLKRILFRLCHYAAAIAICVYLYDRVRTMVARSNGAADSFLGDAVTGAALFMAAYLIVLFCAWLVMRAFRDVIGRPASEQIDRGIKRSGLKPLDRLLGGAFGLTVAAIPVTGLLLVLYFQPHSSAAKGGRESIVGPYAFAAIDDAVNAIPPESKRRMADAFEQARQRAAGEAAARWRALLDDLGRKLDQQLAKSKPKSQSVDDSNGRSDKTKAEPAPPRNRDGLLNLPPPRY